MRFGLQDRTISRLMACVLATGFVASGEALMAQTSYTDVTATGAWNTARWNNSADGPVYSDSFTANNNVIFTSGNYTIGGMGASTNVGNITVNSGANVLFSPIGSTFATGGNVRTIDVASGSTFDFNGLSLSTAAGTGFVKEGLGVLGTGAGTFTGGFTLNAGTVVARGTTGLGSGGSNTLALNGGTITANVNRDFANTRFPGGISIGGNVQFGAFASEVAISSDSARVTFANDVNLGGANRILTLGNDGNHAFSGVISNGSLTFAANPGTDGRFGISNAANTFTGDINIDGGEVRFTEDGSMGNANNDIIIDGGRFATLSGATFTLGASRNVFVGDGVGTGISAPGAGTFTINVGIQDKTAETGSWAKQGGGTLELGGVSTYTGNTSVNNGILRLTTGNNRLPTGTVLSLGQAATSSNLGTLDLNGFNQEVAGLNSTTGSNVGVNTNVITSATAATLTVNGGGTYSDGTAANSGIISGAISLVKSGAATTLTLGGVNTYTGTTTISGGTLEIASTGSINGSSGVTINGGELKYNGSAALTAPLTFTSGTISGGGTIASALTVGAGATLSPGNSPGIQGFTGDQVWAADGNYNWQILDATGSAGTGFDQIQIDGELTVASGFNLNLWSLSSIGPDVSGNALNFDNTSPFSWIIATTTGGIVDAGNLAFANIFVGSNNGTDGFSNPLGGGSFSLAAVGNDVVLSFQPVPEPSTYALLGCLGAMGLAVYRNRRRSK